MPDGNHYKGGETHRKKSIIFERHLGRARLLDQKHRDVEPTVGRVKITPTSMDPLSAFYYLRMRLSPANPFPELKGITDSGRFSLRGELVGEETIRVPAGSFRTFRVEGTLDYWQEDTRLSLRPFHVAGAGLHST
jgi:hypothetical protein